MTSCIDQNVSLVLSIACPLVHSAEMPERVCSSAAGASIPDVIGWLSASPILYRARRGWKYSASGMSSGRTWQTHHRFIAYYVSAEFRNDGVAGRQALTRATCRTTILWQFCKRCASRCIW